VQAARCRRHVRDSPPSAALLDPPLDRLRVGPGTAAQACGLACERFVQFALGGALQDPGDLGRQVSPAARELAQRGHRGGFLVAGELSPLRAVPRLAGELRDEDPVSLRTIIDHEFEYRTRSLADVPPQYLEINPRYARR